MVRLLLPLFTLVSTIAFAQIRVELRPEKPSFLEGEPIYVVADITNIGEHPIGYGSVGHDLTLRVDGVPPYQWRTGCGGRWTPPFGAGFVDHPNTFAAGRMVSLRYLLRGYRLPQGRHQIRVSGRAPVRWFTERGAVAPGKPAPPPIPHKPGDPVVGWEVDRVVEILIQPATADRLRAILESAKGRSIVSDYGSPELEAMYEMSPSLLAETVADLVEKRETLWNVSYESLADLNTAETRAHLRSRYHTNRDLYGRSLIARALARTGHVDNYPFFTSLLPGRSTHQDDGIRFTALSALGCMGTGGDALAATLSVTLESPNTGLQSAGLQLLGRTQSRVAVKVIIDAVTRDKELFLGSCIPLRILTHYTWCDWNLDMQDFLAQPKSWPRWWARNQGRVRLYAPNEEPPPDVALPVVR